MAWKPGDPVSGRAPRPQRELETPHEAFLTVRAPDAVPEDVLELEPVRCQVGDDGYDPRRRELLTQAASWLHGKVKPAGHVLTVGEVHAVFQANGDGLVEVLFSVKRGYAYVNGVQQPPQVTPMTAWLRGTEIVEIEDGWS